MKETITVDHAIEYLNQLLELDKPAIAALLANRVPCNQELANHPTVQASTQHGGYHVGLLGIINGLFGVDEKERGPITLVFDKGELAKFVQTDSLFSGNSTRKEDDGEQ